MRRIIRIVLLFLLLAVFGNADDVDLEVHNGLMLKLLRDMTNKTNASESLNLPANASSIRENITDTFRCENRTYGYYADVDNDCQIFHVCMPSQASPTRNVTYRWSFICPNETIFNQEVLTCTRPRDSIPCEDSPDYYFVNAEIGKTPKNDSKSDSKNINDVDNKIQANERDRNTIQYNNDRDRNRNQIQKRRPDNRKQNMIIDKLLKDVVDEEMKEKLQTIEFGDSVEEIFPDIITDDIPDEIVPEDNENKDEIAVVDEDIAGRLALERSMEANSKRSSFRFRADV